MIVNADCLKALPELGEVDLIFADPPFNINYKYDKYIDYNDNYIEWCEEWMQACYNCLKPGGTFWLAIGDDFVSELDITAKTVGFNRRNWVIWHYAFGVYCKQKFGRCHTHLLYYVKGKKANTFTPPFIESVRQKIGDKRANGGKIPGDVWKFSRVCGTFKERVNHPCQMPLSILERIIQTSSKSGDLVVDPFAGSGTTLVAAKKLGRKFLGIELSENYCEIIKERLDEVEVPKSQL